MFLHLSMQHMEQALMQTHMGMHSKSYSQSFSDISKQDPLFHMIGLPLHCDFNSL